MLCYVMLCYAACLYACTHVHMYACMHACMHACMYKHVYKITKHADDRSLNPVGECLCEVDLQPRFSPEEFSYAASSQSQEASTKLPEHSF